MGMGSYIDSQINVAQTQAFWDPQRLQQLKVNSDDVESLKTAAKEFASLMFHMMLKSMRDAGKSFKTNLCSSSEYQHYTELMDQQWAVHLAHSENNQMVDSIVKQFTKNNPDHTEVVQSILQERLLVTKQAAPRIFTPVIISQQAEQTATVPIKPISKDSEFFGRDDFIDKLLPYAIKAAQTIGMDPKLLLAQAALETGWGAKIAKLPNGECSHNLFGIKAGNDWSGKKVASKTIEYADGIAQRKTDWFRAYDGFGDSMQDYTNLLQGSIRYKKPIASAHVPELYTRALQDTGFATDPNYAHKIMQIYKQME